MSNSRAQVLDQYDAYFRKHLPDTSQECINYLMRFIVPQIQVDVFDEEVAGKLSQVLIKINRVNLEILKMLEPLAVQDTTLVNSEAIHEEDIKEKTNNLMKELLPLIKESLTKIKLKKDDKSESDDEKIIHFIEGTLRFDKGYQKLPYYLRIVKDFEDDPSRNKQLQIDRVKLQLINVNEDTVKFFKNLTQSLYQKHSVSNLAQLEDKLKEQKKLLATVNPDQINPVELEIKIKRIEDHIKFIKTVEQKIKEINDLFKAPLEGLPFKDILEKIFDIMNKISELMKLPQSQSNQEKNYEKQMENYITSIKPLMDEVSAITKDKVTPLAETAIKYKKKKEESLKDQVVEKKEEQTITREFSTINAYIEASSFANLFSSALTTLGNTKSVLNDLHSAFRILNSSLGLAEIKEIARRKSNEQAAAEKLVRLITKLQLDPNDIDPLMLSTLELRNELLDKYKNILKISQHLTPLEALDRATLPPLVLNQYTAKDFDFLSNQVFEQITQQIKELKEAAEKKQDTVKLKPINEALAHIEQVRKAKDKIDFLKEKIATILPIYFTLPQKIKESVIKDLSKLSDAAFIKGPSPKVDELKAYELDAQAINKRNSVFKEMADKHIDNLYNLAYFNKMKDLIIKNLNEEPVKELIKAIDENKPLPPLFKSVTEKFRTYLEANLDDWKKYGYSAPPDEKKSTGKDFVKKWEAAAKELTKFKSKVSSNTTFDLINKNKDHLFIEFDILESIVKDPNLIKSLQALNELWNKQLRPLVATAPTVDAKQQPSPTLGAPAKLNVPLVTPLVTPDYRAELGISRNSTSVIKDTPQIPVSDLNQDRKDALTPTAPVATTPLPEVRKKPKPKLDLDTLNIGPSVQDNKNKQSMGAVPTPTNVTPDANKEIKVTNPATPSTPATPTLAGKQDTKQSVTPSDQNPASTVKFHKRKPTQSGFFQPAGSTPNAQQTPTNPANSSQPQTPNLGTPTDPKGTNKKM